MKLSKIGNIGFSIVVSICCFIGCSDKDNDAVLQYDPTQPVKLSAFSPDSGKIAEKVILEGANFGSDPAKIKVYFNTKRAAVIGVNGTQLYVVCPKMPGDTCTVAVVIGNDSVVYDQKFRYKVSVSVTTIVGNGTLDYHGGTLAEATLKSKYLCVDNDNNIFVTLNDDPLFGLVRINEEENIVMPAIVTGNYSQCFPMPPYVDLETGIVYAVSDSYQTLYVFDPANGWAPKYKALKWKEGTPKPADPYKKAVAFCQLDGCIYLAYYNGHIVRVNPKTLEAETIAQLPQGDSFGMAFHPKHPELLYFSFAWNAGVNAHSICTMDVTNPSSFTKISGPGTAGHRDGPVANAQFSNPGQIFFDRDGNLYIADRENHCIRRLTIDNLVETVLGVPGVKGWKDGGKEEALFDTPEGIGVGKDGTIYVSDWGNSRVRKLSVE